MIRILFFSLLLLFVSTETGFAHSTKSLDEKRLIPPRFCQQFTNFICNYGSAYMETVCDYYGCEARLHHGRYIGFSITFRVERDGYEHLNLNDYSTRNLHGWIGGESGPRRASYLLEDDQGETRGSIRLVAPAAYLAPEYFDSFFVPALTTIMSDTRGCRTQGRGDQLNIDCSVDQQAYSEWVRQFIQQAAADLRVE